MLRRIVSGVAPPATLVLVILASFASLVADPTGLIVDPHWASVDTLIRGVNTSVGNDLTRQYLPRLVVHARELREFGRLSSWDDTGFGGRPAIGNPQASRFYPPVWPVWWLGRPAGLGWLTLAHLFWGGLGVIALGRASELSLFTSLAASICVQLCPYVILQAYEGHYPHLWTFSWYPWAFWATLKLRNGHWRCALSLAPILALASLAGHAQEWFYLVISLILWVGADLVGKVVKSRSGTVAAGSVKGSMVRSIALLVMIGLALGMAAIEIVPAARCEPWTLKRARHTMAEASAYHIEGINLLQWMSPTALGGPTDYIGPHNACRR